MSGVGFSDLHRQCVTMSCSVTNCFLKFRSITLCFLPSLYLPFLIQPGGPICLLDLQELCFSTMIRYCESNFTSHISNNLGFLWVLTIFIHSLPFPPGVFGVYCNRARGQMENGVGHSLYRIVVFDLEEEAALLL